MSATKRTRCARSLTASGAVDRHRGGSGAELAGGVRAGRPVFAEVGRARRDGGSLGTGPRHAGGRAVPRLPAGTRRARTHGAAGEVTGRSRGAGPGGRYADLYEQQISVFAPPAAEKAVPDRGGDGAARTNHLSQQGRQASG